VIRSADLTLVMLWVIALVVGVVMVASASYPMASSYGAPSYFVVRHGVYTLGGIAAFGFFAVLPLKLWRHAHRPFLILALLLCLLVLIPGIGQVVNGSRRWIGLGGISIQASELAKFLILVYLAGYLGRNREQLPEDWLVLFRPLAVVSAVCILLLLEPDFGSVVVLAGVTGGMFFVAGARLRHFLLIVIGVVAMLALISVLQRYRMERLVTFLDPWSDAFGSGYQLTQSLIAFGRGELFGLGLGEGIQKLFYLPEAHNDFIFAVIAEELGLVGAVAVFGLLIVIVLRMFRIGRLALERNRAFEAYLAYGAGLLIGLQSLINVGVSTGALPTKGLTLPFVSYGGNSLLVCCALAGLSYRVSVELNAEARR
jgi:cell division protein FtsW